MDKLIELTKEYILNVNMREHFREGTGAYKEYDAKVKYLEARINKLISEA
ncbi:hypothetical protein [Bacillus toyonensis]|nr:hypothetical protein [Bacillus toyonensis]